MRPVSYTHLDVYKRQQYEYAADTWGYRIRYLPGKPGDVYKRQGINSKPASSTIAGRINRYPRTASLNASFENFFFLFIRFPPYRPNFTK